MKEKLRELRLEHGLTQKQLANELSSTDKNIWAYEKGIATPPYEVLIEYAKFFEVSADYLLGLEDDFGARVPGNAPAPVEENYSAEERKLIEKYRKLNASGKKLINTTFDTLLTTAGGSTQKKNG